MSSHKKNRELILIFILLVVGLSLLYKFNPAQTKFYPKCIVYHTTGLYCPSCGLLRGLHNLLNADIQLAFRQNLLILLLPALYVLKLYFIYLKKKKICALKTKTSFKLSEKELLITLFIAMVYAILRNINIYPFSCLAPI